MPKFLCIHTFPAGAFTRDQVCQVAQAAQQDPQVRAYRSFFNLSEGKAVCILEAPSEEALSAWFQKMSIPTDSIMPLELEGYQGEITTA